MFYRLETTTRNCIVVFLFLSPISAVAQVTATDVQCSPPGCVGTIDLANGAVTAAKLSNSAVTSAKISDGSITDVDINAAAGIDPSKISGVAWTTLNDGADSALDADKIDAVDSTQFLRSDIPTTSNSSFTVIGNTYLQSSLGVGVDAISDTVTIGVNYAANAESKIGFHTYNDIVQIGIASRSNEYGQYRLSFDDDYTEDAMSLRAGKLGIGTISPTHALEVVGQVNANELCIAGDCRSNWQAVGGEVTGNGVAGNIAQWSTATNLTTSPLYISGEKVGIGTANPSKPLTIYSGDDDPILFQSNNNHNWYLGPNVNGQRFALYDATDNTVQFKIESDGDMCLGTCH